MIHVMKLDEIVSHAVETLFVVRLSTCLPFFLTLTFYSHSHTNHSLCTQSSPDLTPSLSLSPSQPVTWPPCSCSLVQPGCLVPQGPVLFHNTHSLTHSPLLKPPAHFPVPVQRLPPSVTHPTNTHTYTLP